MDKNYIDASLAKYLIRTQFPKYSNLDIKPMKKSGWDNRMFKLGDDMLIRIPSAECYAPQVKKEHKFLPRFKKYLSFEIPKPIAFGEPCDKYLFNWSIYKYIDGETATPDKIKNKAEFAKDIAKFLNEFEKIDVTNGPEAGEHNFYRGGNLKVYDDEVKRSIEILKDKIDTEIIAKIWNEAIETKWRKDPVWVHGDLSMNNLLVKDGKLYAIIDFGCIAIGDPACDLAIAWTDFDDESRKIFKNSLNLDEDTWNRGKAWALWKALIIMCKICEVYDYEAEYQNSMHIINEMIKDYKFNH